MIARHKEGETYVTTPLSRTEPGKIEGARVEIVVVNGAEYLRTNASKTARDNRDNLPRL